MEKRKVLQCLHFSSAFGFEKTLLVIGNRSRTIIKGILIIYPEDAKITHLNTMKMHYNFSLKWMGEDLSLPKSLKALTKNYKFCRAGIIIRNEIVHGHAD